MAGPVTPSVDTVIVNYNTGRALSRCIRSVAKQAVAGRIVVVDNASSDNSAEACAGEGNVIRINNNTNRGFAAAVNQGASGCNAEFLLILNPDCELSAQVLPQMVRALREDPAAALAGPCVLNQDGSVQRGTQRRFPVVASAFKTASGLSRLAKRLPSLRGVDDSDLPLGKEARPVEAVSGACMLVRRDAFEAAGGMDEAFVMHFEDLDLMARLRDAGYHCLLVPTASVTHAGGISSRRRPYWVHFHKHRGMQLFLSRHPSEGPAVLAGGVVAAAVWTHWLLTLPLAALRR